jgi:hypothetical protein
MLQMSPLERLFLSATMLGAVGALAVLVALALGLVLPV